MKREIRGQWAPLLMSLAVATVLLASASAQARVRHTASAPLPASASDPRDPVSDQVRFAPATTLQRIEFAGSPGMPSHQASTRPDGDPGTGSTSNPSASPSPLFNCLRQSAHSQQNWHESTADGRQHWTVSISGSGCSFDLRAEGTLTFTHDAMALQSIAPGGYFEATERLANATRRIEVRPNPDGALEYRYAVNGASQPFDASARAWFASLLVGLERQTGFAVEVRVPALLQQGGPNAVLDEIAQLGSDYVRSRYYLRMLASVKLDAPTLRRALSQARQIKSDYELARVLMQIGQQYELADEPAREAFLADANQLRSDYEHSRVLLELLRRPNLSRDLVALALKSAQGLHSDYECARVLTTVAERNLLDDANVAAYLAAATGMSSDYERSRSYLALLGAVKLTPAALEKFLRSAATMNSDYELAHVLVTVSSKYRLEGAAREAYQAAAEKIHSEYERNRALAGVTRRAEV